MNENFFYLNGDEAVAPNNINNKIRAVSVEDAVKINQLKRADGVYQTTANDLSERCNETRKWIESYNQFDTFFIYEDEGEILGYCILEGNANNRVRHVANLRIAVDNKRQGQGIGKKLLEYTLNYADNWTTIKRVELSVLADNKAVINWYSKFGFKAEGTKKKAILVNGVLEDLLMMGRVVK